MISVITTPVLIFTDNRYYGFAITDKASGGFYGCRGMAVDMNTNMGELGYWVGPSYWNRGIATEAACVMIEYGFRIKKFHKINFTHCIYNPASGCVMEKAGMEKEGGVKAMFGKLTVLKMLQFIEL